MKYILILFVLFLTQKTEASLVINEVLSNEPGSTRTLEWFELFNNTNSTVDLSEYTLIINSDTILLPSVYVAPESYSLVCRKLFSVVDEPSFESYWGNGSKIWGDSEYEAGVIEPIEATFSLRNDTGLIQLFQQDNLVSSFVWNETGDDATSWEKKSPESNVILQSIAKSQSTPGFLNSIFLLQLDIAVESVSVSVEDFVAIYTFKISNRGLSDIDIGQLKIFDSTYTTLLQSINLNLIPVDSSIFIETMFNITSDQLYTSLNAIISSDTDMRTTNDTLEFLAVSSEYPPLIISEFLANPQGNNNTEWIEIYNRSKDSVNLSNWYVGDALKVNQIISEQFFLEPNQYVVLVKSVNDFLAEYPLFDGLIIEPRSWAILNDGSDNIRLQDNFKITADNYSYNSLYDENFTASREIINETFWWGRSSEQNGTPGYENILFVTNPDKFVKINLSSKYISPDGDGYEDNVLIDIEIPVSKSYTLKIYNVDGNIVKTFYNEKELISNQIEWDGLGDNSKRLPIGIYILYLTTEDGINTKETIVIAR